MTLTFADGRSETSELLVGPEGFAYATFGGDRVESEVPNLLLAPRPVMKKSAAAKVAMKKPAAAPLKKPAAVSPPDDEDSEEAEEYIADEDKEVEAEEDEEEDEEAEAEAAELPRQEYTKMWYKAHHCIGIRQRLLGKKQIASVGGKTCGKSRKELEDIADKCIAKLEGGEMCEKDGKTWLRDQIL